MKTIAMLNAKGGVGKTTSALCFADILARDYDKRVLVIDLDAQRNTGSQLAAGVALGVEIYNQHPLVIIPCQNIRKTECGGGFADSSLGVQHRYCFHVVFAPFDSDRRIIFQYP